MSDAPDPLVSEHRVAAIAQETLASVAPQTAFSSRVERWYPLAEQVASIVARVEGVALEPELLLALVTIESGGDPGATSARDAAGLAQVRTPAFTDMVARYPSLFPRRDRYDVHENLLSGALYLVFCARYLEVDLHTPAGLRAALHAYNLGPEAARSLREHGYWRSQSAGETDTLHTLPQETRLHAQRVLAALGG